MAVQDLQLPILNTYKASLPAEILKVSPKITRGENYLGLPWLVLDQPRYFERENIFAIRTMFWWGKFFSTTLQLSGSYKDQFESRISAGYDVLRKNDFHISHSDSPWNHHFEEDNYRSLDGFTKNEFAHHIQTHAFIKLAKKISLGEWDNIAGKLEEDFRILVRALS